MLDWLLRATDFLVVYLLGNGRIKSYLEAPSQELVLHLQKVAFICLRLKRLIDDGKLGIVLDVLPAGIAVTATPVKDRQMLVRDHNFSFCSQWSCSHQYHRQLARISIKAHLVKTTADSCDPL